MSRVFAAAFVVVLVTGVGAAVPAHANRLTKQCQTMARKAHPATLPDDPAVVNLRHSYYKMCINRRGKMDQELFPNH